MNITEKNLQKNENMHSCCLDNNVVLKLFYRNKKILTDGCA